MRHLIPTATVLLLGAALGAPSGAAAATKTVTVTGTVVHAYTPQAASPPCVVASFVRWKDVAGTQRAVARYLFTGSNGTAELSTATKPAPFDDRFTSHGLDVIAPPGEHQLYVNYASHQGTGPRDCSQDPELAKSRASLPATAKVVLTVDKAKTPACATAKRKAADQKKVVSRLRARVRKARGTAKRRLQRQLRSAADRQKRLDRAVGRSC